MSTEYNISTKVYLQLQLVRMSNFYQYDLVEFFDHIWRIQISRARWEVGKATFPALCNLLVIVLRKKKCFFAEERWIRVSLYRVEYTMGRLLSEEKSIST